MVLYLSYIVKTIMTLREEKLEQEFFNQHIFLDGCLGSVSIQQEEPEMTTGESAERKTPENRRNRQTQRPAGEEFGRALRLLSDFI